ncbi:MAG: hypothetical protein QW512_04015, partial [Thermofilaceae archaeon]
MKSLVRASLLTLSSMGFEALLREVIRRITGKEYCYRGIPINSDAAFRLVRNIVMKGYDIYRSADEACVRTYFGELCVDAK